MIRNRVGAAMLAAMFARPVDARAEDIGVPACDRYVQKYEACIAARIPEGQRAYHRKNLEDERRIWLELAKRWPELKPTLEAACNQSAAATHSMVEAYGCDVANPNQ